jgi:hypothetical protein
LASATTKVATTDPWEEAVPKRRPLPQSSRRNFLKGARVERSLYERANGYNYEAVKIFMPAGSKQPVVVHYMEHCPPDVGAAFIWLKNRDPEHWRDVQNVEHAIGKYIISDKPMTAEQWAAERATVINDVVEELPAPPSPESKQH